MLLLLVFIIYITKSVCGLLCFVVFVVVISHTRLGEKGKRLAS